MAALLRPHTEDGLISIGSELPVNRPKWIRAKVITRDESALEGIMFPIGKTPEIQRFGADGRPVAFPQFDLVFRVWPARALC